jgi:CubicO group peptidase (beta-lactamase class C family)
MTVVVSTSVFAQVPAKIDAVVLDEMHRQNIVGMAVAIVKNGNIHYAMSYGYEDLQRNKPVTTHTIFRWGSVSKTLTATAALMLAEENPAFSLDDSVTKHVHYWPADNNKGDILIKHLLSHRSGIVHYRKTKGCFENPYPDFNRRRHPDKLFNAPQSVAVFKDQKLCFDPGESYRYSTFGYSLLGAAIEGRAGTSYANWVRKRIQIPLGMGSLQQASGRRTGFDMEAGRLKEVTLGNAAWRLPGGGWESNILDLAKFANGLLQGSLLNKTSRLWTTVPGNPSYGYGIKYSHDKSHVWHEGMHFNSRALLYLVPGSADQLGIVIMTNSVHSKPMRIARRLERLLTSAERTY